MLKGITIIRVAILFFVLSALGQTGIYGQWLEGYSHRMKITFHESMIPGDDPLTDFPVLFFHTDTLLRLRANGGEVGWHDGRDICFTGTDGLSKLEYEFEEYNPVSGKLVAWIRIPSLSATTNTEVFLYFGDPSGMPPYAGGDVWSNQYTTVWHMNNDPSDSAPQITDATTYSNNGTTGGAMTENDLVEGKISSATDFDGVDDYATMPVNGFDIHGGTVEMWIKLDSIPLANSYYFFAHRQEDPIADRIYLKVWDTGEFATGMGSAFDLTRGSTLDTATWYHLALTWDESDVRGFINGVLDFGPEDIVELDTLREIFIMAWMPSSESANGTLDEVRVSNKTRTADWILASFNNQNQPGLYYEVSSLEEYTDPCNATTLTINDTCNFSIFSNIDAGTSDLPDPGCGGYLGGEVWFRITVPSSGSIDIQTDTEAEQQFPDNDGWMYRLAMALYEGTCNDLTLIGCYENNSTYNPRMASATLTDRIPGEQIWIRVWENSNNDNGKFKICATGLCPEIYHISGGGAYCQGDTGVSILLSDSHPGTPYVLRLNDSILLDTLIGTGEPLTWASIREEGVYKVLIADTTVGCSQLINDSVTVEILPLPQLSFDITSITCFDDNDGSIQTTISGVEPYLVDWSGPGGFSSSQKDLTNLPPGDYLLHLTDGNQCFNESNTLTINEPDLLVVLLDTVTHLTDYESNNGEIQMGITGGTLPYMLRWTGTDGFVSSETIAAGLTVGYYSVWVTDNHLCMDSMFSIMVSVNEDAEEVFIPEGFSPNGDGNNDLFVILGLENFPENELVVFNRQGVEVLHRVNYENDWDGQPESGGVLGGMLSEGTYYYIFKFGELNIRKGTIYLNRE